MFVRRTLTFTHRQLPSPIFAQCIFGSFELGAAVTYKPDGASSRIERRCKLVRELGVRHKWDST